MSDSNQLAVALHYTCRRAARGGKGQGRDRRQISRSPGQRHPVEENDLAGALSVELATEIPANLQGRRRGAVFRWRLSGRVRLARAGASSRAPGMSCNISAAGLTSSIATAPRHARAIHSADSSENVVSPNGALLTGFRHR